MVRGGRYGEKEDFAINEGYVVIGWDELPALTTVKDKEDLRHFFNQVYPNITKNGLNNELGQVWRFLHEIKIGDFVAMPLKKQASIIIGKVTGEYIFREVRPDIKHMRKVEWIKTIPRSEFDQDLLFSLGAFMTVCQIQRNDAENRIKAMLKGEKIKQPEARKEEEIESLVDVEGIAEDEITKFIIAKFKGHGLARLVEAVLKVEGYTTRTSPPGPDGGVDILASRGSFGFEQPRICIQVKSGSSPIGVNVYRELRGVISRTKADQGLLVSWSGFTPEVEREAKDDFFIVRLWDSGNLLNSIFEHYDKFNEELKAELPLKPIWTLVREE